MTDTAKGGGKANAFKSFVERPIPPEGALKLNVVRLVPRGLAGNGASLGTNAFKSFVERPIPLEGALKFEVDNVVWLIPRGLAVNGGSLGSPSSGVNDDARREELETFVTTLFKHATPGNWVSLRSFPDDRDGKPFKITPVKLGDLNALIDKAYRDAQLAANARDKVVFCPPIATFINSRHAGQKDLAEGLTLSVECDENAQAARKNLDKLLGPATVVVESGGKWNNPETGKDEAKLHIHYRLSKPTGNEEEHAKLKLARDLATQFVGGDPSNVPMVHPIRWPGSVHRKGEPRLCRIVAVNPDSEIDLDAALVVLKQAAEYSEVTDPYEQHGNEINPFGEYAVGKSGATSKQASIERVMAALEVIPNDDLHWNDWNKIGMATWLSTNGAGEGLAAFGMWSAKSEKYDARRTQERWLHYYTSPPTQIGAGTLFHLANEASPEWETQPASNNSVKAKLMQTSAQFVAGFVPPDYLVDGLLQRRYVYSMTAPTGSGKTAIALRIAVHVAGGLPLAEREVEKGRVLFAGPGHGGRSVHAVHTKSLRSKNPQAYRCRGRGARAVQFADCRHQRELLHRQRRERQRSARQPRAHAAHVHRLAGRSHHSRDVPSDQDAEHGQPVTTWWWSIPRRG